MAMRQRNALRVGIFRAASQRLLAHDLSAARDDDLIGDDFPKNFAAAQVDLSVISKQHALKTRPLVQGNLRPGPSNVEENMRSKQAAGQNNGRVI